jgi:hypothetical protein
MFRAKQSQLTEGQLKGDHYEYEENFDACWRLC